MTNDIEVLKLGKLSSQKNDDNIEKYYDERNWIDMSDDRDSDERCQIDKNDEEIVPNDIKLLKLGNFGSQKNTNNIGREYDEINWVNIIDDK